MFVVERSLTCAASPLLSAVCLNLPATVFTPQGDRVIRQPPTPIRPLHLFPSLPASLRHSFPPSFVILQQRSRGGLRELATRKTI